MDTVVIGLTIIAAAVGFLLWEGRPFGIGAGGPPSSESEADRRGREPVPPRAVGTYLVDARRPVFRGQAAQDGDF